LYPHHIRISSSGLHSLSNRLQKFARGGRGDLGPDELDHIQWKSADRHDDGNLPNEAYRDDERKVWGGPDVMLRGDDNLWDDWKHAPKYSGKKAMLMAYRNSVAISAMTM